MKRDPELVRKILFAVETMPSLPDHESLVIEGYTDEEVSYHVMLLDERKYLKAFNYTTINGPIHYVPWRLTWAGHEFLDAVRAESVWEKTKKALTGSAGSFTFEVIKSVATEIILQGAKRMAGF